MRRMWDACGATAAGCTGAGRIKAALEHERIVMSRRRINRIMKAGGMADSYSRARPRTSSAANSMATPRARTSPPTRPT